MVSRERDRIERQRFEQQQKEIAEREEAQRLAPIRSAEAELAKTAGKLLKLEREAVANGKDEKASSLLSPAMLAITPERPISLEQAKRFNEEQARLFAESTPEFYPCQENAEAITGYCNRNGIQVADAATYRNIFERLNSFGLMQPAPAPTQEPEIVEQPAPAQQTEFEGVDESGRPKSYTRAEVERMSANEYKRFFRLPTKQVVEYRENGIRW